MNIQYREWKCTTQNVKYYVEQAYFYHEENYQECVLIIHHVFVNKIDIDFISDFIFV